MPSFYKTKNTTSLEIDEEAMQKAITDVENKGETISGAARKYSIKRNGIKHPFQWDEEKMSGKVWLQGFMRRNKNNLRTQFDKYNFNPSRILNLDETGITTVMESPKVIAEKGKRIVFQITSAERGTLVTMVGIVNAAGNHIPPVFVYPRKRMNPSFLKNSVAGAIALVADSGWMNAEIFPEVLTHIKNYTRCSIEDPIHLLLDNHVSHCSLEAVIYCKNNGIVLLSFPPHTSHKLQPLDVSVFAPFKRFCKAAFNNFHVTNPGMSIKISDLAEIVKQPFMKAFCPENITSGFLSTGVFPFNNSIFAESEFCETENTEIETIDELPITAPSPPSTSSSITAAESVCNLTQNPIVTSEVIRPYPKLQNKKVGNRGRAVCISRVYTDTPEKTRLEELAAKKKANVRIKAASKIKKKEKHIKQILQSSSEDETYSIRDSDQSTGFPEQRDDDSYGDTVKLSSCLEVFTLFKLKTKLFFF